jgi:CheY-like chemotaxis protein
VTSESASRPDDAPLLAKDEAPDRLLLCYSIDGELLWQHAAPRAEGHEVLEAANGCELFWFAELTGRVRPIDVVISDLCMPGYSGLDVVEAWADPVLTPPRARVVLMSAFPDREVRRRAEAVGALLLEKPFALGDLCALVRTLMEAE